MKERAPREKKVRDYEEKMSNCLDQIENIWLKDNKYLTGNNITIADLFGACEVEQPSKDTIFITNMSNHFSKWLNLNIGIPFFD